jgi:hypothetical protein
MRLTFLLVMMAGLLATGCDQGQPPTPPPASAPPAQQLGNTPPEDLDPFVVMIGAERWTVILDRALEGAIQAPSTVPDLSDSDLYRTDAALKSGAAKVIELRNMVCGRGLLMGDACKLPDFPAWTREPPNATTPLADLDQRSAWLSEVMDPFTSAGCEAGRKATSDDMFCSVE